MNEDQKDLAKSLLIRAGVSEETAVGAACSDSLSTALEVASELIGEESPDALWWRDYFSINGEHMHLTEDGWIPAYANAGDDAMEVLDEINRP